MNNGGFLGTPNFTRRGLFNNKDILFDKNNIRTNNLFSDCVVKIDPYLNALNLTEAQRNNIAGAVDFSGRSNCGQVLYTNLTKAPINTANSFLFDGTNDSMIVNVKGIPANSARSLMVVAYVPSGCLNRCFAVHWGSSTRASFGLSVADTQPYARLWTYSDDVDSSVVLTPNTVHLLFGTYDGARGLKLYTDNLFTPYSKTLSGDLNVTSTTFYIGSADVGLFFNSHIYFVGYWTRYFTATEYAQLYYYMKDEMGKRNVALT